MSFRITRTAKASWQGTDSDGSGRIELASGAFEGPYSLRARVEDVERATNPEELIAAAEAGCFTMSVANMLSEAGHPPTDLETTASVRLEQDGPRFSITTIELRIVGEVPGVDADTFSQMARRAEETCPVSRALAGARIELVEATLAG